MLKKQKIQNIKLVTNSLQIYQKNGKKKVYDDHEAKSLLTKLQLNSA